MCKGSEWVTAGCEREASVEQGLGLHGLAWNGVFPEGRREPSKR